MHERKLFFNMQLRIKNVFGLYGMLVWILNLFFSLLLDLQYIDNCMPRISQAEFLCGTFFFMHATGC